MLVAKTSVGSQSILIQTIEDSDVEVAGSRDERQTEPTAIGVGEAYQRAKAIIATIAADFASDLKTAVASGQKIELEFTLGLSASSGLWMITGKGEAVIKVKMIWEGKLP
jgi:hypothetical protein